MKRNNNWQAVVTAYKASGLRQTEWCRANNVNLNNLRYWLQKEDKQAASLKETCQWVTLDLSKTDTHQKQHLFLYIGPVRIEVNPGFDPKFLTDVVRSLRDIC